MTIGDNIKKYRKCNKLTQKELGDLINKSAISIRKYEANDITPSIQVLTDIALALNITINELTNNGEPGFYSTIKNHNSLYGYKEEIESFRLSAEEIEYRSNYLKDILLKEYEKQNINNDKLNINEFEILYISKIKDLTDKIEELQKEINYLKEVNILKDNRINQLQTLNDKIFKLLGGGTDGE